jgi:Mce-associated membrane protein
VEVAPARTGRALSRLNTLVIGLVLLLVAVLAAAVTLGKLYVDERSRSGTELDILQAARQHVVNINTIDYRHVDRDTQRILAGGTGAFAEQYAAGMKQLKDAITKHKSVSTCKVLEAGLVSANDDAARVLVVADSQVTNVSSKEPIPRHYRLQLDMIREGGRWLTPNIELVG